MSKAICLLPLAALSLSSCITPEPPLPPLPPEPVIEHHYHTRNVYVLPQRTRSAPVESADSFRAVERPGTYSQ